MTNDTIYATDGMAEVQYTGMTPKQAAQAYVEGGDWGDIDSTIWITVYTYRNEDDDERESHTIAVDPKQPDCDSDDGHDWKSPHKVVGGLKENPGVHGHGGGVIIKSVCAHCGTYLIEDTWAQNPDGGEQGLRSVRYEEPDETSLAWVEAQEGKA